MPVLIVRDYTSNACFLLSAVTVLFGDIFPSYGSITMGVCSYSLLLMPQNNINNNNKTRKIILVFFFWHKVLTILNITL